MAQPIGKAEYEKLASFRYALRQFMHFSEAAAREAGITPGSIKPCWPLPGCRGATRR